MILNKIRKELIQNKLLTLIICSCVILIPLQPPIYGTWDDYKLILMSIVPIIVFGTIAFTKNTIKQEFVLLDISWLIFLGIGFLSFFWATNGSLIWYYGFGWLELFLWMLIFRMLSQQKLTVNYLQIMFVILFWLILVYWRNLIYIDT